MSDGIAEVMGLQALKMFLGINGRADFYTAWEGWAGDIIYVDERIVVMVYPCVFYGCPDHPDDYETIFPEKVRIGRERMKHMEIVMSAAGWRLLAFFECQIVADPKKAAEEVVAALEAARPKTGRYAIARQDVDLANLARLDFSSRVQNGDTAWRTLVRNVSEMASPIRKSDLAYVMIRHHNWEKGAFELGWKCLLHHEVVIRKHLYTAKGPLLEAALMDCGFKPKKGVTNVVQQTVERPRTK